MHIILRSLLFGMLVALTNAEEATKENTRGLPMMTWHHPTLEPGLAGMTLVCKVVSVSESERYQSPYWNLRLQIDERIHVDQRYEKRLEGIRFLDSGDFRKKAVGDKIIVFAGGEPYQGDDFLIPCWSGTNSDLGIALSSDEDSEDSNEALLTSLRRQVKSPKLTSEEFQIFANHCPKGVAEHFIWKMRVKEMREDGTIKTEPTGEGGTTTQSESGKPEFHYTLFIAKPAREVWDALVTKETVDRYFMAPLHTLELKDGGKISYGKDTELITGKIVKTEAPTKLVHSFNFAGSDDPETQVTYEIEAEGEQMCSLTISHTGFAGENQTFAKISGGWPVIASSLKTLLETGKPLPWPE